MSKFENEQEKKVRKIIETGMESLIYDYPNEDIDKVLEAIMLRIRPYLKVQKKWMGDAL